MGTVIESQLRTLVAALFSGMALALVYDLFRAIRRRKGGFTASLDALFCLLLTLFALAFALRLGEGELRLYVLITATVGAVLFSHFFSKRLRSLWDFWARVLFSWLRLLRLPAVLLYQLSRRGTVYSKRAFLLWYRNLTKISYRKDMLRAKKRASVQRRVASYYDGQFNKKQRISSNTVHSSDARPSVLESSGSSGSGVSRSRGASRRR